MILPSFFKIVVLKTHYFTKTFGCCRDFVYNMKKEKNMGKIKKFFSDFKKFISRGNVIDMAIGVVVATAFTAIVTALTNKIIMPFINWLLALGGAGLDSAFTFLKTAYTYDDAGNKIIDLANSIYIDWGAFITAIINFILIALVLFIVLRVMMNAQGFWKKELSARPTKDEKKVLKEQGVNMKDRKEVLKATQELREKNKPAPVPPAPTQEELLTEILSELKKQNGTTKEEVKDEKSE